MTALNLFSFLFGLYLLLAFHMDFLHRQQEEEKQAIERAKEAYRQHERQRQTDIFYYLESLLTPQQKEYLPAARWLVNQNVRGEGRTYLLAVAHIEEALRNPGRTIPILDHYPNSCSKDYLAAMITDIVWELGNNPNFRGIAREFQIKRDSIVFRTLISFQEHKNRRSAMAYPADPFKTIIDGSWN